VADCRRLPVGVGLACAVGGSAVGMGVRRRLRRACALDRTGHSGMDGRNLGGLGLTENVRSESPLRIVQPVKYGRVPTSCRPRHSIGQLPVGLVLPSCSLAEVQPKCSQSAGVGELTVNLTCRSLRAAPPPGSFPSALASWLHGKHGKNQPRVEPSSESANGRQALGKEGI